MNQSTGFSDADHLAGRDSYGANFTFHRFVLFRDVSGWL